MILKKKVIKNYIEVVPATHRLKIGEKLHLFKTHSNVHEYLVTFGHHRFTGTCILGRKRWLGVAFLTTEEAAAGCCPAPGWPQAPRPVVTPGVGREASGGSPARRTSALPAHVPSTPPRLFLSTVGVDTVCGQRLGV